MVAAAGRGRVRAVHRYSAALAALVSARLEPLRVEVVGDRRRAVAVNAVSGFYNGSTGPDS